MKKQDFLALFPGQYIYDPEFNTYGEVIAGSWTNHIWPPSGWNQSGISVKWDDGDCTKIEISRHKDIDISRYELIDFIPS